MTAPTGTSWIIMSSSSKEEEANKKKDKTHHQHDDENDEEVDEKTFLLRGGEEENDGQGQDDLGSSNHHYHNEEMRSWLDTPLTSTVSILAIIVVLYCATQALDWLMDASLGGRRQKEETRFLHSYTFPKDFVWGAATSSYQIEGAVQEDGRGRTIWDEFCTLADTIMDNSTGEVACDHYHRVVQDVQLMASLQIKAYRFSIAWSRILPHGTVRGGINQAGIDFYNHLIDTLLAYNIQPWVTLFHWDLPLALYRNWNDAPNSTSTGGWLDKSTITAFADDYARLCFQSFGDRVQRWITMNEAWTVAVNGHATGIHAPGRQSATEPYIVGHHLLLAHVKAVQIYKTEFQQQHQDGMIGISNSGDFRYPKTASKRDVETAQRAMEFQFGWFTDPLFLGGGDYPSSMRERLGDRLPTFTPQEQDLLREWGHQTDFVGLNYYSSLLASEPTQAATYQGYWADIHVDFSHRRVDHNDDDSIDWTLNDMDWPIVPDGLHEMLHWIAKRYHKNNPLVFITENGSAEKDVLDDEPQVRDEEDYQHRQQPYYIHDEARRAFLEAHLRACAAALLPVTDNTREQQQQQVTPRLGGYFAWSLMDNFEWQFGYQRRFGIVHVDFDSPSLTRTPKRSAYWYKTTIEKQGKNIPYQQPKSWFPVAMAFNPTPSSAHRQRQRRRQQQSLFTENDGQPSKEAQQRFAPPRKELPERLLIGYGSDVDKVRTAVHNGVNVVIWSFVDIRASAMSEDEAETTITKTRIVDEQADALPERRQQEHDCQKKTSMSTNLDLAAIQKLMAELDHGDFHHVVHLVSFGGWNGPHLDPNLTASEWWYDGFMEHCGQLFDGLDWDLEGHDDLKSPTNFFSLQTLQNMGEISRLAKRDGYWIGMAPPQSYLDMVTDNNNGLRFSQYVNLTDPLRPWHSHFSYYGANVYAYLMAKYGDSIDFVSIQFYESYSRAADAVFRDGQTPTAYLQHYLNALSHQNDSFLVDIPNDFDGVVDNSSTSDAPKANPATIVSVPCSKLVLGLANGWALNADLKDTGKVFFLRPDDELRELWQALQRVDQERSNDTRRLPRGFMFWTINEEGQNEASLASDLASIIFQEDDERESDEET